MLRMKKKRKNIPQTPQYCDVDEAEEVEAFCAFRKEGFDPTIDTADTVVRPKKESRGNEVAVATSCIPNATSTKQAAGAYISSPSGWELLAARAEQQRAAKRTVTEVETEVSYHKNFMEDLGKHAKAIGFIPDFSMMDSLQPSSSEVKPGDRVVVHGLKTREDLNGQSAVLVAPATNDRITVQLDSGEQIAVNQENLAMAASTDGTKDTPLDGLKEDSRNGAVASEEEGARRNP